MHTWQLWHTVHTVLRAQHMTLEGPTGQEGSGDGETQNVDWEGKWPSSENITDWHSSKQALMSVISTSNSPGRKNGAAVSFVANLWHAPGVPKTDFLIKPLANTNTSNINSSIYIKRFVLFDWEAGAIARISYTHPTKRGILTCSSFKYLQVQLLLLLATVDEIKSCISFHFFYFVLGKRNLLEHVH